MTRTISVLRRGRNSRSGNPTWEVEFQDGTFLATDPESQVGTMIENSEYRDVPLHVTTNAEGKITRVDIA